MRQYPHLTDATNFPNLDTNAPYKQYANTFDYTRWTAGTRLTVCNVPWDDNRNIIGWESDDARDKWFDGLDDAKHVTLESEFQILPDGEIKLPIPFATLSRYNYVFVEYPTPTSAKDPLDYADANTEIRKWGFFINHVEQVAPSTSRCILELDDWTTFGNHVKTVYMQLTRGHAPMAEAPLDAYLKNPIMNSGMLLTPDVNYGGTAEITRDHTFIPFAAGEKYVMFTSLMNSQQLEAAGTAKEWTGSATPPVYKDTDDRWGHQWEVIGYDWKYGEKDYSGTKTPATPFTDGGLTPVGGTAYALRASEAKKAFQWVVDNIPQFMQTIQAMWIIPAELLMVETSQVHMFGDVQVFKLNSVGELPDIQLQLDKTMFGYDEKYADITKLYTYPYASLELSDNDGKTVEIRIENTGDLKLHRRVSLAYPYLKSQMFLTGVNGVGSKTYEFRKLDGTTMHGTSWDTDFADFMTSFDIPTYALYMDGYKEWATHNSHANLDKARLTALNAYKTGQRSNNTNYENGKADAKTANDNTNDSANTAYNNTYDSAETAYGNGKRVADTAKTIGDNTALTTKTNADRSAEAARDNAKDSAKTAQSNGDASANTSYTNNNRTIENNYNNTKERIDRNNENIKLDRQNNVDQVVLTSDFNRTKMHIETDSLLKQNDRERGYYMKRQDIAEDAAKANMKINNSVGTVRFMMGAAGNFATAAAGAGTSLAGASLQTGKGADAAMGGALNSSITGVEGALISTIVQGGDLAVTLAKSEADIENMKSDFARQVDALGDYHHDIQKDLYGGGGGEGYTTWDENTDALIPRNFAAIDLYITESNRKTREYDKTKSDAVKELEDEINLRTKTEVNDKNNSDTKTTTVSNNKATFDTATGNADRTYTAATTNNKDTYTRATDNNRLNWETQLGKPGDTSDGGNLGRSRALTEHNAERTRDTTTTNAKRSLDTENTNLLESREATEYKLKTDLEQAQATTRIDYENHVNDKPVTYGSYSGDPTADLFAYRGAQIRVKTQSESAIRQAGDQMLRYGYKYEGAWTPNTLNIMKHFTYWEASELWMDSDSSILDSGKQHIRSLFTNGVTVWRKPEDIGRVGLYDNLNKE